VFTARAADETQASMLTRDPVLWMLRRLKKLQ